jgi:hypothetical protein
VLSSDKGNSCELLGKLGVFTFSVKVEYRHVESWLTILIVMNNEKIYVLDGSCPRVLGNTVRRFAVQGFTILIFPELKAGHVTDSQS